jgi:hypothetical protein
MLVVNARACISLEVARIIFAADHIDDNTAAIAINQASIKPSIMPYRGENLPIPAAVGGVRRGRNKKSVCYIAGSWATSRHEARRGGIDAIACFPCFIPPIVYSLVRVHL